jgi:hypothetical protein
MKFAIRASVKGAPYDAAAIIEETFEIELVKEEDVATCAGIGLYLTTETVRDRAATRAKLLTYDVPSKDDNPLSIELPAHFVESNKDRDACLVKTIAQYKDPHTGEWLDSRDSDWSTLHMEANNMYIAFFLTQ